VFVLLQDAMRALLGIEPPACSLRPATVLSIRRSPRCGRRRGARNIEIRLKCNPWMRYPRLMTGRCESVELTATGTYDEEISPFEQRFIGSYGVAKGVTERKPAEETVYDQAYHDLLIGLPNRALFRDHLGLMLAQAKRRQKLLARLGGDEFVDSVMRAVQGYYYSPPLSCHEATALLGRHTRGFEQSDRWVAG